MPASCRRSTVVRERIERSIALIGREETQRVVAPIVAQAARRQERLVDEGMDRQQLERRHAEPLEMIDHGRRAQRAERAAQLRGNVLPQLASGL